MKFHASILFEFNASDVGQAGRRVQALLEHASEAELEMKSLELATPSGTPVTLPLPTRA